MIMNLGMETSTRVQFTYPNTSLPSFNLETFRLYIVPLLEYRQIEMESSQLGSYDHPVGAK